ncbi:Bax inhibitor-1/YccA family protein [Aeromicrobium sp.]|uniref:Bax inhibitor-1/YccA family protein n=1 Tax=Aeromicrobium sp. TaxID=1871063 RepID=UPI0030BB5057
MQSNNPIFTRNAEFNGRAGAQGQTDPSQWQIDLNDNGTPTHTETGSGRMTIDSVVEKTAITLALVVAAAAVAWVFIGNIVADGSAVDDGAVAKAYALTLIGGLGGFALVMINAFKKVTSPALVIGYAVLEGLFVGAFSKLITTFISADSSIIFGAVLGTFAAVAGTLAAYKFFNIQVGAKFRKIVIASVFGFVAVSLLSMVMSFFGSGLGVNGFGPVGFVFACLGLVLGVFMLILDFDFVEKGIAAGLPERESWQAALGLTVTIVWIYTNILRILAIINSD